MSCVINLVDKNVYFSKRVYMVRIAKSGLEENNIDYSLETKERQKDKFEP